MIVKLFGYLLILILLSTFLLLFFGTISLKTVAGIGVLVFLVYVFLGFPSSGGAEE